MNISSAPRPRPRKTSRQRAREVSELRQSHGVAVVRIAFGLLWGIDALFKWQPGFVNGQTLKDELGGAADVSTPIVHQWMQLWNTIALANPSLFAHAVAVTESLLAVGILLGIFSKLTLVASALFSLGLWTGAEGMGMPWFAAGQTDLGPSIGYVFASLGLFFASAGTSWSIDEIIANRIPDPVVS